MTNEEAIARIREHIIIHKNEEPRAIYITEALKMAIKALESQKNITNEELYQENIGLEAENERLHDALEKQNFKGKTNGDVIKAVFPNLEPIKKKKDTTTYILEPSLVLSPSMIVFDSWWNSPYKEGDKE